MKSKLFVLLLIAAGISPWLSAQDFDMKKIPFNVEKHKVIYEGDIDVPGVAKDSLYAKTFAALKAYVKNMAGKVTRNDPATGVLIVGNVMQGMMKDPLTGDQIPDARIKYVMRFNVTDGKVNYSFSDFMVQKGRAKPLESYYFNEPEVKMKKDEHEDFFHSIDYEMVNIIKSLTRKLNK